MKTYDSVQKSALTKTHNVKMSCLGRAAERKRKRELAKERERKDKEIAAERELKDKASPNLAGSAR